ncbi:MULTISPECIES: FKBP-type peptidyl-prolyl cis-trans isomerase [unclassified Pseudoalteromonas]|uniref:FKBP-type peptidyl-prolyl cis-trans isomerase n=1 Tax=unclassified Pseudoalteromonas TaxID=194690 RepID=UPI000C08320B|nr:MULTISPECIES: FKBP-type peptidyl-prolyl cis-trans isomerase [unclassified Pseudoalteromonas]MDP2635230.1 FKBP-type peptidyl-prolyl cis-trans isomerase [Pseudoalteromonas sp. 1_MG-2023]PHN90944.1 peptidylprolyl isomerase [Pseudoalteromonas sp. 3D05]
MSQTVITENSEVIFHFSIKLSDGSAADSTKVHNKPAKLVMGDGSLTANFEKCLFGLAPGDSKSFELEPEDAFGQPNPDNIYYVDRSKFGSETPATVGSIIAFTQPDGTELPGLVREVQGESVTIDFNHPLAGQKLTFEVEILEVDNTVKVSD